MIEIRQVLTMDKDERDKIKQDRPELAERVALHWNSGKICAQCKNFTQLGTQNGKYKNTGLNGTCHILSRGGYLKTEDKACGKFENKQGHKNI